MPEGVATIPESNEKTPWWEVCMDIRSLTWIGDVFSLFSRIQKKETSNKNEHEIHAKVAIKAWSCPKQGALEEKAS